MNTIIIRNSFLAILLYTLEICVGDPSIKIAVGTLLIDAVEQAFVRKKLKIQKK